ncbi:hypothetical protein L596_021703 [Steinernema carpocapsae]|uniref:Uncharacterized protein n=1 Tax=Steinernema carpocapsae TaxID=34508 RepID=A0A4U5MJW5_STECR|nr:hypothetical protein L596_021703 [Steinernema carpocapsae]
MDCVPHAFVDHTCRLLSTQNLQSLSEFDKTWFNPALDNIDKIVRLNAVVRRPFRNHIYCKLLRRSRKVIPEYENDKILYRIDDLNISPSNATNDCDILPQDELDRLFWVCAIDCTSLGVINMDTLTVFEIHTFNVLSFKKIEINNCSLTGEQVIVEWLKRVMLGGQIQTFLIDTFKFNEPTNITDQDFTRFLIEESQVTNFRLCRNENFPNFGLEMFKMLLKTWQESSNGLGRDLKIWNFDVVRSGTAKRFIKETFCQSQEERRTYVLEHENGNDWVETDFEMVYFHKRAP